MTLNSTVSALKTRCTLKLKSFSGDESGVNAIEFAFVAPFLMAAWLGTVSVLQSEHQSTKIGKVTAAVGDIIAQAPVVNKLTIDNAFKATDAMLGNADSGKLEVYVAGIEIDNRRRTKVLWSRGKNLTTLQLPPRNSAYPLSNALKSQEGFLVVSRGRYRHTPLYGDQLTGEQVYDYQNQFSPRVSIQTTCSDC